jgi:hypothetical protein
MTKCKKCEKGCNCQNIIPDSPKKFPDGANYRIEVSGIENVGILGAVVEEAKKCKIPIHRAIATVAGSSFYSNSDLTALARFAAKEKIEVIICPDNLAHGFFGNPNRNLNWQDKREIKSYIDEIHRCVKLGFRGFLTWSFSMLAMLTSLRDAEKIPSETIFKVSTFANCCNVLDFILAKRLKADTVNAANGLTLQNLADIRKAVPSVVIDVHIIFWQNYLAENKEGRLELKTDFYDRIADAPEIARIASPVYFKFEAGTPGIGVYDVPRPDWSFKDLAEHKRKDVRVAAQIMKTIKEKYPQLKLSDWGPEDLRVPRI